MRLFLDTEFTGINQRWPRLISIALINETGDQTFYAELPPESYFEKVTSWVSENVLPKLHGESVVMEPDKLRTSLIDWLSQFDRIDLCSDSKYDFKFIRAALDPMPDRLILIFTLIDAVPSSLLHNALLDVEIIRSNWIQANSQKTV